MCFLVDGFNNQWYNIHYFQLLTAMLFQRFSVSSSDGKRVSEEAVPYNPLFGVPPAVKMVFTKRI